MADIRHNVTIKTRPEKIYGALTLQEGLENWWTKDAIVKPEVGFVNVFTFGKYRNEMKVTTLIPDKRVVWKCISSIEEWFDTNVSFELEEKGEHTLLRFTHGGWREVTDTFAGCNYDWATFLKSLKSLCETGTGMPAPKK